VAGGALELGLLEALRHQLLVEVEDIGELEAVVLLAAGSVLGVLRDGLLDQREDVGVAAAVDQQLLDGAREQRCAELTGGLAPGPEHLDLLLGGLVERPPDVHDVEHAGADDRDDDQQRCRQDHLDGKAKAPAYGHPPGEYASSRRSATICRWTSLPRHSSSF